MCCQNENSKFKSSKVQNFKSSNVQKFKSSKVQKFKSSKVQCNIKIPKKLESLIRYLSLPNIQLLQMFDPLLNSVHGSIGNLDVSAKVDVLDPRKCGQQGLNSLIAKAGKGNVNNPTNKALNLAINIRLTI